MTDGTHDEETTDAVSASELKCIVMRLERKLTKRDKRILGMEKKIAKLERALGARTIDLESLSKNVENSVTNALCNVRMIPVFGIGRDRVITEVRNVDA